MSVVILLAVLCVIIGIWVFKCHSSSETKKSRDVELKMQRDNLDSKDDSLLKVPLEQDQ